MFGRVKLTNVQLVLVFFYFLNNLATTQSQKRPENQILQDDFPEEIQKKYPFFLSGFDKEGSPVWVIQYGKWDVRQTVEEGKLSDELEKWTEHMWDTISDTSLIANKTEDLDGSEQYFGIADLDGYNLRQFTHFQTVQKHLALVRQFATVVQKKGNFKKAYVINSNFLFQSLWNLIRPILGGIATNIELYGTNPDTWKPILLRDIPKDQLPEFLGGVKDHTPVKIYG